MLYYIHLVFIVLIIPSQEWTGNQTTIDNIKSIAYSPDDQWYLVGGTGFLDAIPSEPNTNIIQLNVLGRAITEILACEFTKDQKYVGLAGNTPWIYFCKFPEMILPSESSGIPYYLTTLNTEIDDIDFSYDGSKLIACGDKEIVCFDFINVEELLGFAIENTTKPSCEYSNVQNKFGWTDGKSIHVVNNDYSTFFRYENQSLPGFIEEIKFVEGNPYPIILINNMGIVKTAASKSDWKIINIGTSISYFSMSVTKDGSLIAISGTLGTVRIYESSEFIPFNNYNVNIESRISFEVYRPETSFMKTRIEFSHFGKNFMSITSNFHKLNMYRNCTNNGPKYWNCTEECGDLEAHVDDCDLGLGIMYDGCTDKCSIEENFNCTVNATDFATFCSYYGNISLKLIKITKNLEVNEHIIVLSIFPPLHSLANLNESEISEIFGLPPQFIGISYTYNNKTGEIDIRFETTKDLIDGSFYIDFNPEKVGIDQYFAKKSYKLELTGNENLQIFPIYLKNNFLEIFSMINSYVSIFIPVSAWLLFFVGLFTKSLSCLEAIITFQFCGLTLHWLQTQPFIGFTSTFSMKYLSGYNIVLKSDLIGTEISTIKDYSNVARFGIDLNYFINNLNITLLFCVPFLLAFLVIFILILKERRENIEGNPNPPKMEKLKALKRSSLDFLLYSISPIYIPFMEYFVLFIETGQTTHLASWLVSLLYLLVFFLVLIGFFMNPLNFETFWLSFRAHRILLHHYLFILLSLTIATILLIKCPNLPYLSAIPCVVMFLYTLIYHPYPSIKENLRSTFNFFVICCFLTLNILVLNIPKEHTNPYSANILLAVNLAVLLPIVLIISIISCVYYCYLKFYILPKQMDLKDTDKIDMLEKSILVELNKANLEENMKRQNVSNTFFRNFIIPSESIYVYSNRLIIENENYESEEREFGIANESGEKSERNVDLYPTTEIKTIKIPELKKQIMLNKQGLNLNTGDQYDFEFFGKSRENLKPIEEINEDEDQTLNELVKETIKDENLFINTKHIVNKVEILYEDCLKNKEENEIYLDIYEGIKEE